MLKIKHYNGFKQYYVDVGNLNPKEAEDMLDRIMKAHINNENSNKQ